MFADDTKLNTAEKPNFSHKLEANRNNDLNTLKEYRDYNRLSLNIPKCEFMLIVTTKHLAKCQNLMCISQMSL